MTKWIVGIVVLVGVGVGAWLVTADGGEPVETSRVMRGEATAFVEELAETRLARTYAATMPVDGRVLPIEVEAGDEVSAGQVVARLDATALEARVAASRARIAALEAEIARNDDARLERTLIEQIEAVLVSVDQTVQAAEERTRAETARLDLARREREDLEASMEAGAATDIELQRARVEEVASDVSLKESFLTLRAAQAVRAATAIGPRLVEQMIELKALDRDVLEQQLVEERAALATLEEDLRRATIESPVDGVVLSRAVDSERVLAAGTVLVEIGRLEDLEIEIEMLTDEAGRVEAGDEVEIEWRALESPLTGRVTRVEPRAFTKVSSLGVEQQRVLVIVGLDESSMSRARDAGMGAGYRVRTRVVTARSSGLVVARGGVFRDERGAWGAFVVRDERARLVGVTPGLINQSHVEVREGLAEGDEVIVSAPAGLEDGSRVRVVGADR